MYRKRHIILSIIKEFESQNSNFHETTDVKNCCYLITSNYIYICTS